MTISVAPISWGVAAGLVLILVAGAAGIVAIGLMADGQIPTPSLSAWLSHSRG